MNTASKIALPSIAVFAGGTSAEREVSLGSGEACVGALREAFASVDFFCIDADALPGGIDPARHVVFSTLHGTFGEDGGMQRHLEAAGICYAGCASAASELTMDKTRTKLAVAKRGVPVIPGISFVAEGKPDAEQLIAKLGSDLVVKPNAEGSSVGLHLIETRAQLAAALADAKPGTGSWLVEKRIFGRELAVGVLDGRAMGIVEIRPKSGVYDYASKYTKGLTDYLAPAPLDAALATRIRAFAETAYDACGCRDFARVDFMLAGTEDVFLIEINTLPGMKETSLLPKSAQCAGLNFNALVREMVAPAVTRFLASRNPRAVAT